MSIVTVVQYFTIILCFACGTSRGFRDLLYEGSDCILEDGNKGLCKPLSECPSRLADVSAEKTIDKNHGMCSFVGFVMIVCCPVNIIGKIEDQAADTEGIIQNSEYPASIVSQVRTNALTRRRHPSPMGGSYATGPYPYPVQNVAPYSRVPQYVAAAPPMLFRTEPRIARGFMP